MNVSLWAWNFFRWYYDVAMILHDFWAKIVLGNFQIWFYLQNCLEMLRLSIAHLVI